MIASRPLILAGALAIVAWLTAGSMALRSVSRLWLRHWAEQRLRGSTTALTYLARPQRLLAAAGAGVALTLVLAGMVLGTGATDWLLVGEVIATVFLMILVAQLVPRAIARQWATPLVPVLLPGLWLATVVAFPFLVLGRLVARPFERGRTTAPTAERDVVQDLLREGELEGVGEQAEIAIINGVVDFGDRLARDVMTPREQMFAVPDTMDAHTLAQSIAQAAYSRIPVYRGTLDNIAGMVLAFDLLETGRDEKPPVRPVAFAAPAAPCNELLFRMLRNRTNMAIVRDDNGRVLGLLTLEDLLEELVGDIRDEHDEPEPPRTASATAR